MWRSRPEHVRLECGAPFAAPSLARPALQHEFETVCHDAPGATDRLAGALLRLMRDAYPLRAPLTAVCIGSDRTTGDCLGPLVGEYLRSGSVFSVYGTLDEPVHAANLLDVIPALTGFVLAVDAALGEPVGGVAVRRGTLAPGAAFGRDLPAIGDVAVSGLVCEPGGLGFERLRSVRLSFVRRMAHVIASALTEAAGRLVTERAASERVIDIAALETGA
jgi:putative sporulation protein YyaC